MTPTRDQRKNPEQRDVLPERRGSAGTGQASTRMPNRLSSPCPQMPDRLPRRERLPNAAWCGRPPVSDRTVTRRPPRTEVTRQANYSCPRGEHRS